MTRVRKTASRKCEAAKCKVCGTSFIKTSRNNIYCSKSCRDRAQSDIHIKRRRDEREKRLDINDVCLFCEKPIIQTSKYRPRKFCSSKCGVAFHKRKYRLQHGSPPLVSRKKKVVEEVVEDQYKYHCFFCPMRGWRCRTSKTTPCYKRSKLHVEYQESIEYWNTASSL